MRSAGIVVAVLMSTGTALAQEKAAPGEQPARPALVAAMKDVKTSLAAGLKAAEKSGAPISAKFELEDGKLQLSVYTAKADKFFEVVVDHHTGKIVETEAITDGEDLAAAKRQSAAMAKARRALRDVVASVEKANAGFKVVSVEPALEGGAPRAAVSLLKGTESKQVDEKL